MKGATKTSWDAVSDWYDTYLESSPDSYQAQVIAPNLLRVLALKPGETVLDVGCGQGYFTRLFAEAGAAVVGSDASKELITKASKHSRGTSYHVQSADALTFAENASFDTVTCVLALQNIKDINAAIDEMSRVVKKGGRVVLVVNHPAFRVPQASSWGFDEASRTQYRRVDRYLSAHETKIVAHPSDKKSPSTLSYHHSLQDIFKSLHRAHLATLRVEEWISHRKSEKGPRQLPEDTARKEFPLFLLIEARKLV